MQLLSSNDMSSLSMVSILSTVESERVPVLEDTLMLGLSSSWISTGSLGLDVVDVSRAFRAPCEIRRRSFGLVQFHVS